MPLQHELAVDTSPPTMVSANNTDNDSMSRGLLYRMFVFQYHRKINKSKSTWMNKIVLSDHMSRNPVIKMQENPFEDCELFCEIKVFLG